MTPLARTTHPPDVYIASCSPFVTPILQNVPRGGSQTRVSSSAILKARVYPGFQEKNHTSNVLSLYVAGPFIEKPQSNHQTIVLGIG